MRKIPFSNIDDNDTAHRIRDALCDAADYCDYNCLECMYDAPIVEFKKWLLTRLNEDKE